MSSTSSRGNPSLADIARSIAVLGAIILALFALGRLLTVTPDEPTRTVDYRSAVESSRTVADFELFAPDALPTGWRATSVRFERDSWHLGVLTADDDYVGLEQVTADTERAVERFAPRSRTDGDATIAGEGWTRWVDGAGETTYVRRDGDMTVLVTGSAPRAQIERYVASLSSS